MIESKEEHFEPLPWAQDPEKQAIVKQYSPPAELVPSLMERAKAIQDEHEIYQKALEILGKSYDEIAFV